MMGYQKHMVLTNHGTNTRDYYVKEAAKISWHYYSIIVPGFPQLDWDNTFKFLSPKKVFPSAFFSPLLVLQSSEGNIFKVMETSILQRINSIYLAPAVGVVQTRFLEAYHLLIKIYPSHLKFFRTFNSCAIQFTWNM